MVVQREVETSSLDDVAVLGLVAAHGASGMVICSPAGQERWKQGSERDEKPLSISESLGLVTQRETCDWVPLLRVLFHHWSPRSRCWFLGSGRRGKGRLSGWTEGWDVGDGGVDDAGLYAGERKERLAAGKGIMPMLMHAARVEIELPDSLPFAVPLTRDVVCGFLLLGITDQRGVLTGGGVFW